MSGLIVAVQPPAVGHLAVYRHAVSGYVGHDQINEKLVTVRRGKQYLGVGLLFDGTATRPLGSLLSFLDVPRIREGLNDLMDLRVSGSLDYINLKAVSVAQLQYLGTMLGKLFLILICRRLTDARCVRVGAVRQ
jgi:hypothetical protein